MFWLQFLKLLKIYVANSLVPLVNLGFDLLSFCEHRGANIICLEDDHPPISTPMRDQPTFVLNEACVVIEPYLHSLGDHLSNRD